MFRGGGGGGGLSGDSLAPYDYGWNAYDFFAGYDGGMLSLALVEDEMRSMREASKPHRMRRVTVGHCPVEPHHALQSCGPALWTGQVRLAGRVELDPIALPACEGWVVVHADELSDDVQDGWRNAPCPAAGGGAVGSDGSGDGWEDSRFDPPARPEPEPEPEDDRPVWILLADSLAVNRGNMGSPGYPFTGAGPDGNGTWPLRWARWYYAEGEPGWTIVQFYSEGSWAHGGSRNVGCVVVGPDYNSQWNAQLLPSGTSRLTGGAELLPSGTPARRLDGSGNPIPRVPAGYSDDPARLWTMRFPRSSITRLTSECFDNVWTGSGGELYFTTVPLPPSP